jgi:RNA-directed DNA polymerase
VKFPGATHLILGFQHQAEADRFLENFRERLGKFGLELHPDKTRRIEFGRFAEQNRKRRGEGKPETFDFLGFKHISGKNRLGRFTVRRKTIRKCMGAKLREIKQQLRQRMHDPVRQTGQWLKSVVQGYFNYYAVPRNTDSLSVFRDRLTGHWGIGGRHLAAEVRNAGSPGHVCSLWLTDGSLDRASSILIPRLASPPDIRDKNRMR